MGVDRHNTNIMKKVFTLMCLFLLACGTMAQSYQETIYLKNGSVIKGEVIEQNIGESIKIKTKDGSIFVYKFSEVEKIEKSANDANSRTYKGLDFNIDFGYNIATEGGGGNISVEAGLGKRFKNNLYWGISSGAYIPTGDGDALIPVATDFKLYFPFSTTRMTPSITLRGGYVLNTGDDEEVKVGKNYITIEKNDYMMFQIMPGLQIPLSKRVDLNLAAGYTHFIPTGGGDGSGMITFKAGFGFHRSNVKKAPKPIRDKGLTFSLDINGIEPWNVSDYDIDGCGTAGINALIGYKVNKNWSFAAGFNYSYISCSFIETATQEGYNGTYSYESNEDYTAPMSKLFLRAQYRMNDKRLSPFMSLDYGLRFYGEADGNGVWINEVDQWGYSQGKNHTVVEDETCKLFIAPAIGLSLRTTNNSYLEIRAGYEFSPKLKSYDVKDDYKRMSYSYKTGSASGMFISIGWTHTFNLGSNWNTDWISNIGKAWFK